MVAVGRDQINAVRLLLARRADVNFTTPLGVTALGLAKANGNVAIVQLLQQGGAIASSPPGNSASATEKLTSAAGSGDMETVVLDYYLIALVLYVIFFGLIGVVVGQRKGRAFAGFVFGALLGPIGWLIVALGPDIKASQEAARLRKCPFCAELVQPEAKVCKHCGRNIKPISSLG